MPPIQTYRAIIRDPKRAEPQADKHGTMTITGALSTFGREVESLRKWAKLVLPGCSDGAYCEILRVEEVLVERVDQEVTNAPANS